MRKRVKHFLTIQRELFLLSVVSLLLVSLVISGVFLKLLYDSNLGSARGALRECNSQIVTFTEGLFRENAAILELLAQDDLVIHAGYGDKEALLNVFDAVLNGNENLTYAYAGYASSGLHIRNYAVPKGYDVTTRPWYRAAMATDDVAQLAYSDAVTGVWLFSQCRKLIDEAGNPVGVIALECSNRSINRQLGSKYRYNSQRSFIINKEGMVLIHPSDTYINRSLREYMDEDSWAAVAHQGENYAEYMVDGVRSVSYFERIPGTDFKVVTAISASEVMNPIFRGLAIVLGTILALSVVLGLLLSRLYIHRFARPIRELSGRIRNLAAGIPDSGRELGTSNAEIQSIADNIEIIVTDIATREERRKTAEYLSLHDSMTGIYNHRFFVEELARLDTQRNYPLCIICCDVNGLKLVNDVFGHALGDRLLCVVAHSLQGAMRTDDILARVGGDEFSLILPRTADDEAQQILRRLRDVLPSESLCGAEVSISLGYALKTEADQPIDNVLRTADEMMYRNKAIESAAMKRHTVANIIAAAQSEGLVQLPKAQELQLLHRLAAALCPESDALLLESYRLRKLGLCTLLLSLGLRPAELQQRHTETGFRILSTLEEYRGAAACVLHYNEHWDGSGWPSGLAGLDIPLLSRIIAVVEAYTERGSAHLQEKSGIWYDAQLVDLVLSVPES